MNQKNILILYAYSGALGHKIIAQNYYNLLSKQGYKVTIKDVFELDKKNEIKFGNILYFWILKKTPKLWQWLYINWQSIVFINWFRTVILPSRFKITQKFIKQASPDTIITTHPIATSIVNYLKKSKQISAELITVLSDWHIQKFWLFSEVDKYLVATEGQRRTLKQMKVPVHNTEVVGILLSEDYYQRKPKPYARELLGFPQNEFFILIMGGGTGWGIEKILDTLENVAIECRIIVISSGEKRMAEIRRWVNFNSKIKNKLEIFGHVDPYLYFSAADLLISKPGGLTTSQAFLLKLPLLVMSSQPGHEEENLKVLKQNGAVIQIKEDNFSASFQNLLQDKNILRDILENGYKLAPIDSPEKVLNIIASKPL